MRIGVVPGCHVVTATADNPRRIIMTDLTCPPATTAAEREVADLLPIDAPEPACRAALAAVPFWCHTFALNRSADLYTAGSFRDHRYRIPFLPKDFHHKSVLDIGCLDGFYAFLAEARGARRVVAIDNEEYVDAIRDRWGVTLAGGEGFHAIKELLRSEVEYRRIDAFASGELTERFDFVYCCGILHRVENPLGLLRIVRSRLEPDGTVLLETYGCTGPGEAGATVQVWSPGEVIAGDNSLRWGFGAVALDKLARLAGLATTGDTLTTMIDGHPRIIATLRAV